MKSDMDRAYANQDMQELQRLANEYYADPERGLQTYLDDKINPLQAKSRSIRKVDRSKYGY
jgi:hypothetical protein